MSENEILSTMMNGTVKNSTSQRYGKVTTKPRPEMPILESERRDLIDSSGHDHGARSIPREVHLLLPGDRLCVARGVRLRHAHDLAGRELDQVDRQIAEIGDILHRPANQVVSAVPGARRRRGRHEDLLGPDRRPYGGLGRGADAMAHVDGAAQLVGADAHVLGLVLEELALE